MANELPVRANFLGGLIEDNPLASGATTLTSAGLASLPVITSTSHMAIILDPDGRAGNPEIAYVTAHTAAATTATITKGQEGSTARAHDRDTPWLHGPTVKDFDASGGGAGLIGMASLRHASVDTTITTTSTTAVEIDSTNLSVTFTAPPSGKVLVRLSGYGTANNTAYSHVWSLRDSSPANVAGSAQSVINQIGGVVGVATLLISSLTPGTTYTWRWAWRVSSAGTINVYHGPIYGVLVMEVWAVNV